MAAAAVRRRRRDELHREKRGVGVGIGIGRILNWHDEPDSLKGGKIYTLGRNHNKQESWPIEESSMRSEIIFPPYHSMKMMVCSKGHEQMEKRNFSCAAAVF